MRVLYALAEQWQRWQSRRIVRQRLDAIAQEANR